VTRDVGKKAMFHIWCEECNDKYHRSGTNKPSEACANYLRSHINSDGHIKAYEGRNGLNSSLENQSNQKDDHRSRLQGRTMLNEI
jgi:hypothetical protein